MADETPRSKPSKLCFVTIGATAGFDALITATLNPLFLEALEKANYTDLLLQYGKEGKKVLETLNTEILESERRFGVRVNGFAFNKKGLISEMRAAKGQGDGGAEGIVISHAGSGSILDALRIAVPLIVIPNPALLDNHQEELAAELATQGYVVHGHLDNLPAAIQESEDLRTKQKSWPPTNRGPNASERGLAGVMDDEMGFLD